MKLLRRRTENYRIKGNTNTDLAILPEPSPELFESLYDRSLTRKANVLVYTNSIKTDLTRNFTINLALELARDSYFQVALTTGPNTIPARYADVIIDGFKPSPERFRRRLEKYDDSSRLVLTTQDIWKSLERPDRTALTDYIRGLKLDLGFQEESELEIGVA